MNFFRGSAYPLLVNLLVHRFNCCICAVGFYLVCLACPLLAFSQGSRPADSAYLPFHAIPGWDAIAAASTSDQLDPLEVAILRLGRPYGMRLRPDAIVRASLSPLAWPAVFESSPVNPRRQREETRALLDMHGFLYREIIPLDLTPRQLADTMIAAIAQDHPVLINAPGLAIVYGYDRREPDMWWLAQIAGEPQIILESERVGRLMLWSDDAIAGTSWIIDGRNESSAHMSESSTWGLLERIAASVKGDPTAGIVPYPISLREFRDIMATSDTLPSLRDPINVGDPIGLVRAGARRSILISVLADIIRHWPDTALSQPAKLAEYHLQNSIKYVAEMSDLLYGIEPRTHVYDSLRANWDSARKRGESLAQMTELLKSEKQAMEAIDALLQAPRRLPVKKPRPGRP